MGRKESLQYINDEFGVSDSVGQLRTMMRKVTEKEVSAETVNAACNCVSNINSTIKTSIMAAQFMSKE